MESGAHADPFLVEDTAYLLGGIALHREENHRPRVMGGIDLHTVEITDAIYLVKIKVKTDDAEDLERWLDGEDGDEHEGGDGESLPDDNISQYSNGDDDSSDLE